MSINYSTMDFMQLCPASAVQYLQTSFCNGRVMIIVQICHSICVLGNVIYTMMISFGRETTTSRVLIRGSFVRR